MTTGFPKRIKELMWERSQGMCEICGLAEPVDAHHRRPRGKGGTRRSDTNAPSNGLMICRPCHDIVESRRDFARERGWLVPQSFDPSDVPLIYQGSWALLTATGSVFRPPQGRDRCERCGFHTPTQGHRAGCGEAA